MQSPSTPDSSAIARTRPVEAAAAAGIVYSVTSVVALVLLDAAPFVWDPDATAPDPDDADRRALALGLGVASIAAVALLWFVAVVRRRVGDREDRFFSTAFLGSAIVYVGLWLVGAANLAAPAMVGADQLDRAAVRFGHAVTIALLLVVGPRIQAVFVASAATIFLRTNALPTWVGYLGYAVAAVLFLIPVVESSVGLGMPVFVLVVSVTILAVRRRLGPEVELST